MKRTRRHPSPKLIVGAAALFAIAAQAAITTSELPTIGNPAPIVEETPAVAVVATPEKPAVSPLDSLTLCGIRPGTTYDQVIKLMGETTRTGTDDFCAEARSFDVDRCPAGLTLAKMPVINVAGFMFGVPGHDRHEVYQSPKLFTVFRITITCRNSGVADLPTLRDALSKSLSAQLGEPTMDFRNGGFVLDWQTGAGLQLEVLGRIAEGGSEVAFTLKNDGLPAAALAKVAAEKETKEGETKTKEPAPDFSAPVK